MVYSVFEPPERGGDAADHMERFMFVRDGFSFAAFLFGPLWFLWHRLWLALLAMSPLPWYWGPGCGSLTRPMAFAVWPGCWWRC